MGESESQSSISQLMPVPVSLCLSHVHNIVLQKVINSVQF